jgi:SMC interacting uncharacterized protein involved in chromosome segregation
MDPVAARVQKHVDALHAKNAKLKEENAKLKEQISGAKQLHSRVKKIPKKPAALKTPTA